jgi:hypothetical protein
MGDLSGDASTRVSRGLLQFVPRVRGGRSTGWQGTARPASQCRRYEFLPVFFIAVVFGCMATTMSFILSKLACGMMFLLTS